MMPGTPQHHKGRALHTGAGHMQGLSTAAQVSTNTAHRQTSTSAIAAFVKACLVCDGTMMLCAGSMNRAQRSLNVCSRQPLRTNNAGTDALQRDSGLSPDAPLRLVSPPITMTRPPGSASAAKSPRGLLMLARGSLHGTQAVNLAATLLR
jgi:hypothetical protein